MRALTVDENHTPQLGPDAGLKSSNFAGDRILGDAPAVASYPPEFSIAAADERRNASASRRLELPPHKRARQPSASWLGTCHRPVLLAGFRAILSRRCGFLVA
jgi:hypothetical protein